jgi:hypothetical protein
MNKRVDRMPMRQSKQRRADYREDAIGRVLDGANENMQHKCEDNGLCALNWKPIKASASNDGASYQDQ